MDILSYIETVFNEQREIEEKKEKLRLEKEQKLLEEQLKSEKNIKKSKPKIQGDLFPFDQKINTFYSDYKPPKWKSVFVNNVEITFFNILNYYNENLRYKKIETLSETEIDILNNIRILRDCYCTDDQEIKIANYFIGKFDFDPFSNPYSKTGNPKYSKPEFTYLDGSSTTLDGFEIKNWPKDKKSVFVNPPFSKLSKASNNCNIFSSNDNKPRISLIGNLDYNNYVKESFIYADYCILLGRVQYVPMVGLTVSSPRWNSIMLIYNSLIDLNGSKKLKMKNKDFFAIDLKNKDFVEIPTQDEE